MRHRQGAPPTYLRAVEPGDQLDRESQVLKSTWVEEPCTKHVPGEMLERHLEILTVEVRNGKAEWAQELNSAFELL